jgi:hypothetical protein
MSFLKRLFGREPEAAPSPEALKAAEEVFSVIDAHLKTACVAEVGGFPPPDDPFTSWFGGHAVALPTEPIPEFRGEKMFPLLQVNCSELPCVPDGLEGVAIFVVWIAEHFLDALADKLYGDGFLIREYPSLEGLQPVSGISTPKDLKTLPVKWTQVEDDAPDWSDASEFVDLSPLKQIDKRYEWGEPYDEKYHNHERTKIGGYPTVIQDSLSWSEAKGTFVLQIAHEDNAHWDWVDSGVAYFLKSESGTWEWDCQFC